MLLLFFLILAATAILCIYCLTYNVNSTDHDILKNILLLHASIYSSNIQINLHEMRQQSHNSRDLSIIQLKYIIALYMILSLFNLIMGHSVWDQHEKLTHVPDFSQILYTHSVCGDMKPQQFLGAQVVWLLGNEVANLWGFLLHLYVQSGK